MPGSYGPLATIRRERRQLTKQVAQAQKELESLDKAERALAGAGTRGRATTRGRVAKANRSRTTRRRGRRRAGATAE